MFSQISIVLLSRSHVLLSRAIMLQDVYNKHIHSGMMQKVKGCLFDSHRRARQLGSSCFLAEHTKPKILYIWHARVDIFFYQVSSFRGAFASLSQKLACILNFSWVSTARIQAAESTAYVKSILYNSYTAFTYEPLHLVCVSM